MNKTPINALATNNSPRGISCARISGGVPSVLANPKHVRAIRDNRGNRVSTGADIDEVDVDLECKSCALVAQALSTTPSTPATHLSATPNKKRHTHAPTTAPALVVTHPANQSVSPLEEAEGKWR